MINLTFETFDEMVAFAKQILGNQTAVVEPVSTHIEIKPSMPVIPEVPTAQQTDSVAPIPTQGVTYTLSDLASTAGELMESNLDGLRSLLETFGVDSLPKLPEDKYPEFAAGLRELGGSI